MNIVDRRSENYANIFILFFFWSVNTEKRKKRREKKTQQEMRVKNISAQHMPAYTFNIGHIKWTFSIYLSPNADYMHIYLCTVWMGGNRIESIFSAVISSSMSMSSICFRIQIDGVQRYHYGAFEYNYVYLWNHFTHTYIQIHCILYQKKKPFEKKQKKQENDQKHWVSLCIRTFRGRVIQAMNILVYVYLCRCDWYKTLNCLHCYTDELWAHSCIWKTENEGKK